MCKLLKTGWTVEYRAGGAILSPPRTELDLKIIDGKNKSEVTTPEQRALIEKCAFCVLNGRECNPFAGMVRGTLQTSFGE